MQDNVTVSPLDAWSSAGVLTVMEETGEGAGGEMVERRSREKKERERVTHRTGMKKRKEKKCLGVQKEGENGCGGKEKGGNIVSDTYCKHNSEQTT